MSRIGRTIISIPAGVSINTTADTITVVGPKGTLKESMYPGITVSVEEGNVKVSRLSEELQLKASHGLIRSLIANMVVGVTKGFEKKLEMVGTGYRVAMKGKDISLSVGYSHPVEVTAPQGIVFTIEGNNKITISGISKYMVGQVAANIRDIRPPEPYKGKGIKYADEIIRRKAGKAAKTAAAATATK